MKKAKTTIRFWLRTDKENSNFESPLQLIYQIKGQRRYYAIPNFKLFAENWDVENQRVIPFSLDRGANGEPAMKHQVSIAKAVLEKNPEDKQAATLIKRYEILKRNSLVKADVERLNRKLQVIINDIETIENNFEHIGKAFDVDMVLGALKDKYTTTKKVEPGKNVIDFIRQFANESGSTHKPGTLKVYRGIAEHLEAFCRDKRKDAKFSDISISFLKSFREYLAGEGTLKDKAGKYIAREALDNVTASKLISTLKTLMNYARKEHKIEVNPDYRDYTVSRKDGNKTVITLTQEEFDTLFNLDLTANKKLSEARDIFCFACATGLRYSDLKQLTWNHVRGGIISFVSMKGSQKIDVPLNPYSASIIEKYKGTPKPLPVTASKKVFISDQKLNKNLKELGKFAGLKREVEKIREVGVKRETSEPEIYKVMSIHMARRTFITLSLERGMPIQDVMALSGHVTYKAFRRYVEITKQRKVASMSQAWGSAPSLKVV